MSEFTNPARPYPEWRELLAKLEPLVESKKRYSYDELKDLCGLDVQHDARGRAQFYKFRKHALVEWKVWFEVESGFGDVVYPAAEHSKSAVKRVRWAKRKVNMARAINEFAKLEEMTPAQLTIHAQTAALIEDLAHTFSSTSRKLSQVASKYKLEMSEED